MGAETSSRRRSRASPGVASTTSAAATNRKEGAHGGTLGSPVLEDFVHDRLCPRPLVGALLVQARDHLADQPEREELDADDDEQDAEDQQRPVADRVALRP